MGGLTTLLTSAAFTNMACTTWVQKGLILLSAASLYIGLDLLLGGGKVSWDLLHGGGDSVGTAVDHYTQRRDHVKQVCANHPAYQKEHWPSWERALFYDNLTGVMWCKIPKIASSSWAGHFLDLRNVSEKQKNRRLTQPGYLHLLAREMFPSPPEKVWAGTTSLVINRHPFSRLCSLYVAWKAMDPAVTDTRERVVEKVRPPWEFRENHSLAATPEEFLQFIMRDLWKKRKNPNTLNEHWIPQWVRCPVCRHPFTVFAQSERLQQDEEHFVQTAGIQLKFKPGVQINSHGRSSCKEWQFWRDVRRSTIHYLQAGWAYGPDFQLFQYSAETYLQQVRARCQQQGNSWKGNFLNF